MNVRSRLFCRAQSALDGSAPKESAMLVLLLDSIISQILFTLIYFVKCDGDALTTITINVKKGAVKDLSEMIIDKVNTMMLT